MASKLLVLTTSRLCWWYWFSMENLQFCVITVEGGRKVREEVVQVYCSAKMKVQQCFKAVKQEIPFQPGKAWFWSPYDSTLK